MSIEGIEDWGLYEEGLGLYLAAMSEEAELLKEVEGERKELEKIKESTYSPRLLELDRVVRGFQGAHREARQERPLSVWLRPPFSSGAA